MRTETLKCSNTCRYKKEGKEFPCAYGLLWSGELQFVCTQTAEEIIETLEKKLGQSISLTASEKTANFWAEHGVVARIQNGTITYLKED